MRSANVKLFSHNKNSEGAKEFAKALGIKMLRHEGSEFVNGPDKMVINWGSSRLPANVTRGPVMNAAAQVSIASNKLESFTAFRNAGVATPEWTRDLAGAQGWLNRGHIVFARTMLRASSGRGIVEMLPDHPDTHDTRAELYVKYVKKQHEYRIHVLNGRVIDTQRKGLPREFEGRDDVNFRIRNLENGFVFVRNDGHVVPEAVKQNAIHAVQALGLQFGAADIIWNANSATAYCLEVNTAPGLAGTTVTNYVNAFSAELGLN
jgi:hypothetical protein